MAMSRRRFKKEFKERALRKVRGGASAEEVARACRVDPAILRRWQKESDEFGERAFGGYGKSRHARVEPRSRAIILRLSSDELEAVKKACSAAGCRSLADFARFCAFHPNSEQTLTRLRRILDELSLIVRKLTPMLAEE
jgi:transposase-like protein